ncbi:MAG: glycosyltransferase [Chitinivibrionales bacterium]|nr:glycosyltransferase [Chitinivibrionales bacterium]
MILSRLQTMTQLNQVMTGSLTLSSKHCLMGINPDSWPDSVAVCIPAYNAASTLKALLPKLMTAAPKKNICVVNDGSSDETAKLCSDMEIQCISSPVNKGKGYALAAGFDALIENKYRWIITMDADLQHTVEDLPKFLTAIDTHPEAGIIIGSRSRKPGVMPIDRIVSNTLTSGIISLLCGTKINDSQCGFRAYASSFLETITIECPRFEMETEVILKACHKKVSVCNMDVQTLYFQTRSHISHLKDTLRWIKAVTGIFLTLRLWLRMKHDGVSNA